MANTLRTLVATLAVALAGFLCFHLVGFPVAELTGPAVAVSVVGLSGFRMGIPNWLRDACFLTLGINIGSGVTPDVLKAAVTWPLSFAVLAVTLVGGMLASRALLERGFGLNRTTATLASTPGHLSFVIGLADDSRADIVTVSLVQSIRVLLLTVCVPPFIATAFDATGQVGIVARIVSLPEGAVLYLGALAVGVLFQRWKIPAAFLLAGMAVSASGHLTDLSPGHLPAGLAQAALLGMGALIGTRFRGASLAQFRDCLLAGLGVTGVVLLGAVLGAFAVSVLLELPVELLIVAFAPGGVEAMAAIAVTSGLDPTFVAAHHVFRLVLLTLLIPILARDPAPGTRSQF